VHEAHANIFRALAHPKRIVLINQLRDGAKSMQELSEALDLSKVNTAEHMMLLRDWGLVDIRPDGNKVYCCLAVPEIVHPLDILAELLEETIR
jgi:ArsR family transcriptional regulator